jgi:hypothetical protein
MARTLNGSTQYLSLASGLSLGANDPVWISMWAYRNAAAGYCYASIGVSGASVNRKFITGATNITVTTTTASSVSASADSGVSPANATWFHIIAEFGGASSRACTVNGGTRVENTTTNSLSTAPDLVRVGATPAASALLAGRVAYVGVYSGAPSADERTWLSGLGVPGDAYAPNLVAADRLLAYWPIDGTDSPEPDDVGANDLVLTGSPTGSASPTILLTGDPSASGATPLASGWWL